MPEPLTIYECPECGSLDIERSRCESLPDHDRRRAAVRVFREEDVHAENERLVLAANSARVLIERHRATRGTSDLLNTALRELDDVLPSTYRGLSL